LFWIRDIIGVGLSRRILEDVKEKQSVTRGARFLLNAIMVKLSAISAFVGLVSSVFAALPLNALERKVRVRLGLSVFPNPKKGS
jgi:hypothetical protein